LHHSYGGLVYEGADEGIGIEGIANALAGLLIDGYETL
jgi:hypothetical protein